MIKEETYDLYRFEKDLTTERLHIGKNTICKVVDGVVTTIGGRILFDVDSNIAKHYGVVIDHPGKIKPSGKEINSKDIIAGWQYEISDIIALHDLKPELIIITVGDREDSKLYVNNKVKKAKELGIEPYVVKLDSTITQRGLNIAMSQIDRPAILQLPLPDHLDAVEALSHLRPEYDMDGLTTYQKGLLVDGRDEAMIPATAKGVMQILKWHTSLKGQKVAIVSRSELIGKPLIQLILQNDGHPVILHSKTPISKLREELRDADIVITGCGKRAIFDSSFFRKSGQIIIDCSMEKIDGVKGVGDVNKEDVLLNTNNLIASGYGHTGPATVMGLMENVVKYYQEIER